MTDQLVDQQTYLPPQSYYFFPKVKTGKKEGHRIIFDGNTELEEYEIKVINQFKAYAAKHQYELKPMWTDSLILRFLQASSYKMEKSLNSIKDYTIYRETQLPVKLDDKILKLLNSDIIYLHGRDREFRPIVVFNFNHIDPHQIDIETMGDVLTYFLEYIVDEWMLPGQVENWIFLSNVKNLKIANLAMGSMRKFIGKLQDNYKCRLYKMYILGATAAMTIPWAIIKKFLDGDTVNKVEFYKTQVPEALFTHTNRDQVEERFGGTAPNVIDTFWPPTVTSNNYFVKDEEKDELMSEEEYLRNYENGSFKNMRISPAVLKQVEQMNQPETAASLEISNNPSDMRTSNNNNKNIHSKRASPIKETLSEQEDEEVDYIDYMSEQDSVQGTPNGGSLPMKEFEANFIDYLRMYHSSNNTIPKY